MKRVVTLVLGLFVVAALVLAVQAAEDDKDKTLKGKITCAKCELKVKGQKKCATVIVVKEKKDDEEQDVVYYFDEKAHKKYHGDVCQEGKDGEVSGTVKKDGKKQIVTVKKLKYKDD